MTKHAINTTSQDRPLPGDTLDCGHVLAPKPLETYYGTGYAVDGAGRTLCYACADDRHRAELLTEHETGGYLSGDGKTITTWTGGVLMHVTSTKTARVGFRDVTGRRPIRYYLQATDVHGAHHWTGTGAGPEMYVRMRRAK